MKDSDWEKTGNQLITVSACGGGLFQWAVMEKPGVDYVDVDSVDLLVPVSATAELICSELKYYLVQMSHWFCAIQH